MRGRPINRTIGFVSLGDVALDLPGAASAKRTWQ